MNRFSSRKILVIAALPYPIALVLLGSANSVLQLSIFLGFLLGSPMIGFIVQAFNLSWSLGFVAVVGLLITILAPQLKTKEKR